MRITKENILLPEGEFTVNVNHVEKNDLLHIASAYKGWRKLNDSIKQIDTRGVNLHTGISENSFCYFMDDCVRVSGNISSANTSWDCYDLKRKKRIQVKAASIKPDLSSFGPDSQWDEIYFMDFHKDGKWNGEFDIYFIENNDWIYNQIVNKGKNETFRDQQKQKRRPRFSIWSSIVIQKNLKPIIQGSLFKNT